MRVGFVTGEYPPMQGGVGAFTREVARAMIAQGHEVSVLTRKTCVSENDGIQIYPLVGPKWSWRTLNLIAKWVKV
jgi:hypothetical protein